MNSRNILIGSLVINLALVGAVYSVLKREKPAVVGSDSKSISPASSRVEKQTFIPQRQLPDNVEADAEKFAWQSLQSKDFRVYIEKLRSVDCPEETIRDIITAEVNKIYAGRIRNIRSDAQSEWKYWQSDRYRWRPRKNFEQQKQVKALEKERHALLIQLLGVDPNDETKSDQPFVDYWVRNYDFLPEDKRDQVGEIQAKYAELEQDIYRGGTIDDEDQKKIRELYKKRLEELSTILTPAELAEYDVRASQVSNQLRFEFEFFDANEDEFRKIFAIRKGREDDLMVSYDPDDKEITKRRETAVKETDEKIKEVLGEDRFKTFKRSTDWNYRELVRLTDREQLPHGTADKIYDFKQQAEDTAKQVRANNDYTQTQKNEILKKLREDAEKNITEALGEKGWKRYNDRSGWWLNSIAPRNK